MPSEGCPSNDCTSIAADAVMADSSTASHSFLLGDGLCLPYLQRHASRPVGHARVRGQKSGTHLDQRALRAQVESVRGVVRETN